METGGDYLDSASIEALREEVLAAGESEAPLTFLTAQLDHRNPMLKSGSVCRMIFEGRSLQAIRAEIDKCRLLCEDCHGLITHFERVFGVIRVKTEFLRAIEKLEKRRANFNALVGLQEASPKMDVAVEKNLRDRLQKFLGIFDDLIFRLVQELHHKGFSLAHLEDSIMQRLLKQEMQKVFGDTQSEFYKVFGEIKREQRELQELECWLQKTEEYKAALARGNLVTTEKKLSDSELSCFEQENRLNNKFDPSVLPEKLYNTDLLMEIQPYDEEFDEPDEDAAEEINEEEDSSSDEEECSDEENEEDSSYSPPSADDVFVRQWFPNIHHNWVPCSFCNYRHPADELHTLVPTTGQVLQSVSNLDPKDPCRALIKAVAERSTYPVCGLCVKKWHRTVRSETWRERFEHRENAVDPPNSTIYERMANAIRHRARGDFQRNLQKVRKQVRKTVERKRQKGELFDAYSPDGSLDRWLCAAVKGKTTEDLSKGTRSKPLKDPETKPCNDVLFGGQAPGSVLNKTFDLKPGEEKDLREAWYFCQGITPSSASEEDSPFCVACGQMGLLGGTLDPNGIVEYHGERVPLTSIGELGTSSGNMAYILLPFP